MTPLQNDVESPSEVTRLRNYEWLRTVGTGGLSSSVSGPVKTTEVSFHGLKV